MATLKSFEEVDALDSDDGAVNEEDNDEQMHAEMAMKISNFANVLLLGFKVHKKRSELIG